MPNYKKIEEIIDLARVEDQVTKTVSQIEKVSAAIKEVKPLADLFKSSGGITEAKAAYDSLSKATEKVQKSQDELTLSVREYQKLQDQIAQQSAKISALESDAAKVLADKKEQQRQLNAEVKNSAVVNSAAEGSIVRMRAEVALLQQAYDKMGAAQRNSAQGQALFRQLNGQTEALKKLEFETGRFQRNVGNYTGAVAILEKSLAEVKQKMDDLTKSGQNNSQQMSQLEKEHELLNQILNRQTQGFSSMTMEVRATEKALGTMFAEGLQNTEAFKQLEVQLSNAKRELTEFKDQQKILSSQTPMISAAMVAAKGLAGAYAVGAGAAALFGDEGGKVEKELQKLVAVMTVLQGLQEVHELLEKRGAIAKIASTAATNIQTAALKVWQSSMVQAIVTSTAFRIALIGLTGGLLLLIPLLAYAFDGMSNKTENAAKSVKQLAEEEKAISEVNEKASESVGKMVTTVNDLREKIELAKEGLLDKKKVLEEYNEKLGNTVGHTKDLNEAEKELIDHGQEVIQLTFLKARAEAAASLAAEQAAASVKKQAQAASEFVGTGAAIGSTFRNALNSINPFKSQTDKLVDQAKDLQKIGEENKKKEVAEAGDKFKTFTELQEKYTKEAAQYAKNHKLNFFGDDGKGGDKAASDDASKLADEARKTAFETQKAEIEQQIKEAQDLMQNEKLNWTERLKNAQIFYDKKTELINLERRGAVDDINAKEQEQVKQAESEKKGVAVIQKIHENAAAQRKKAEVKYNIDLRNLDLDDEKARVSMTDKYVEDEKKKEEQRQKDAEAHRKSVHEVELQDIANQMNRQLVALDENYAKKKIHTKKEEQGYQNEKLRIQEEFQEKALAADIAYTKETLELSEARAKASGKQEDLDAVASGKAKLAQLEIDLQKLIADHQLKVNDQQFKSDEDLFNARVAKLEKYAAMAKQVSDIATGFIQNSVDKEKNALQDKEDALDKTYETEVNNINNSSLSEQDKANKLKILEADKMAQTEAIERRKRQLDLERARFEKASNMASIIMETALAVVRALGAKPWTQANIAQAVIVGAIGAANLVKAASAPLPRFETGTESSPEGWALTDEKGPELYIPKHGKPFVGSSRPTYRYLDQGTKIVPFDRVNDFLHRQMMESTIGMIDRQSYEDQTGRKLDQLENTMRWQTQELVRAYGKQKSKTINHIKVDTGWASYIRKEIFE